MELSNKKNAYYVITLIILTTIAALSAKSYAADELILSPTEAIAAAKKAGKNPTGDWDLEKSLIHGWTYEIDGQDKGVKMEYLIDAKSGKLISEKVDD